MKINGSRFIILFTLVLLCFTVTSCSSKNEISKNENGAVIAVKIGESGGEDGRINDWNVYQEDNKYILSYLNRYGNQTEYFEITEQEYQDIMSLDYAKYISEYDESFWEGVADAVYFQSVITYENGVEESTKANMTSATIKMQELLTKYKS